SSIFNEAVMSVKQFFDELTHAQVTRVERKPLENKWTNYKLNFEGLLYNRTKITCQISINHTTADPQPKERYSMIKCDANDKLYFYEDVKLDDEETAAFMD
ncbi:unnamed protein product, partial [Didymodactylos carnosus]